MQPAFSCGAVWFEVTISRVPANSSLARTARMSRFHVGRLFRAQVGTSPSRLLLRTRIERAAELRRAGRCGVTEAALTVGFRDLGRFGRAFRERFGCAPGEMRGRG